MVMVKHWSELKDQDQLSIAVSILFMAILILYWLLALYFAIFRSKQMVLKQREKLEEKNLERQEQIHEKIKSKIDKKGWSQF